MSSSAGIPHETGSEQPNPEEGVGAGEGETSLPALLSTLSVVLDPETYIFATLPSSTFTSPGSSFPIPLSDMVLWFREPCTAAPSSSTTPMVTLILPLSTANSTSSLFTSLTYPCRLLTCNVHSSLAAVGFMATMSRALAAAGVSTNPVAGFYHDHIFVPVEQAQRAVEVLEGVRDTARKEAGGRG